MLTLLNSNNLDNAAKQVNTVNNPLAKVPTGIATTLSAAASQLTSNTGTAGAMGQKDFLTLFTTQLRNQDPTNPVQNEAFVAQLAQFSQLEATTTMADTLKAYVNSMSGQQMLNSANMIGKQVLVAGAPGIWNGQTPVSGSFTLTQNADSVTLKVLDSTGNIVASNSYGALPAGEVPFSWGGQDSSGNTAAAGNYTLLAQAMSKGVTSTIPVGVFTTVNSVSQASDKSIVLNVGGGKSIKLTDLTQIGN